MSDVLYIEVTIDNKYYYINDIDKINNIIRVIRYWPLKSFSNHILDGEAYWVKIVTNNETTEYIGQGKYPKGYITFKNLIGDNYD